MVKINYIVNVKHVIRRNQSRWVVSAMDKEYLFTECLLREHEKCKGEKEYLDPNSIIFVRMDSCICKCHKKKEVK